ncbi:hypothetical protein FH972_005292 [Carpinus fangiana]|uniref:Uncharacterized protein n=1 Tax=Carpinus fangiana TaxID=176857 RepID=A0A5N6QS38_9ROSI|nr:hypothetical protein FH972_005292 [Carpinus fangiana]
MELKVGAASMVLPKRAFRPCKSRNQANIVRRSTLMETLVNANDGGIVSCVEEDGVVRMKIVVKKQDVKQMLQAMSGSDDHQHHHKINAHRSSISSAEQRLNLLRKRHLLRVDVAKKTRSSSSSWSPALQSIPEEV